MEGRGEKKGHSGARDVVIWPARTTYLELYMSKQTS
jgi:hypothetical protein